MSPSATMARGGGVQIYSRDDLLTALRDYAELYGDDFTTAAFNPSVAKWRDRPEDRERYLLGNPKTGRPWPSLNTIRKEFGSWNGARVAAGLSPNRPGPSKGTRRADNSVAPIRGVSDAVRTVYVEKSDAATLKRLERAERDRTNLRRKVAQLETKIKEKPTGKTYTQTKTVTKVVEKNVRVKDERALERAKAKTRDAEAKLAAVRKEVKADLAEATKRVLEARTTATSLASRLERSEATVSELRDERRTTRSRLNKAEDRADAAERERDSLKARKPVVIHKEAPEAAAVEAAEHAAHEAEMRASAAERRYAELAVAVKGDDRRLTPAELEELRVKRGDAGPAIVTQAVTGYVKAIKDGSKVDLHAALTKLASAAVSYRDRL